MSESVVALSLIALDTSLPELSTTVIAALRKSSDVAIGNIVGSSVFNIFAILGITLLLAEIPVDPSFLQFNLWVMFLCAILIWIYVLTKGTIGEISSAFFFAGYVAYLSFIH